MSSSYPDRINRVLDAINSNPGAAHSLDKLAKVAHLSPFHFHRIFTALTGEPLHQCVRRIRLERAAQRLRASPTMNLTPVALEVGFAGLSEFSKAFKAHFGLKASAWNRKTDLLQNSKFGQAPSPFPTYSTEELRQWRDENKIRVHIRQQPARRYCYIRVSNPYGSAKLIDAYQTLQRWRATLPKPAQQAHFAGMQMDDPEITPREKCRYDMGILFTSNAPALSQADRYGYGLSARTLPAGPVAVLHCQGDIQHMSRTWQYLFKVWLPESNREPAHQPAMEVFLKTPEEIGWTTFDLLAAIPLNPKP